MYRSGLGAGCSPGQPVLGVQPVHPESAKTRDDREFAGSDGEFERRPGHAGMARQVGQQDERIGRVGPNCGLWAARAAIAGWLSSQAKASSRLKKVRRPILIARRLPAAISS